MTKIKCLLMYIKKRLPVFLWVLFALSCVGTSGLYAKYVMDIDNDVSVNISTIGKIDIAVTETSHNTFKIEHTDSSKTPAYVRFVITANWADENGNLYYVQPSSYSIEAGNCSMIGGYYYYRGYLRPETAIEDIKVTLNSGVSAIPGYPHFRVTVLAEAIQCWPNSVVEAAWGVTYTGSEWRAYTQSGN